MYKPKLRISKKRAAKLNFTPNYTRKAISVRNFTEQITLFLEYRYPGNYDVSGTAIAYYREIYISIEGFAEFVKYNFVAAAKRLQTIRIFTEINPETMFFVMEYDTSDLDSDTLQKMQTIADRSGFTFILRPNKVIVETEAELNPMLDLFARTPPPEKSLYEFLDEAFFCREPILEPVDDATEEN